MNGRPTRWTGGIDRRLERLSSRQVVTALVAALAVVVALVVSAQDEAAPVVSVQEVCQSLQATADARDEVLAGAPGASVDRVRTAAARAADLTGRSEVPAEIAAGVVVLTDMLLALPDDATPVQLQRAQAPQRLADQRSLSALVQWVADSC